MTEVLPAIDRGLTYTAREPDALDRSLASVAEAVKFAEIIAPTHFVPGGLRGKPDQVLAAFMLGRELGLGPMRALSWITLVDGRPTLAAEAVRALALSRGHEIRIGDWTKTRCVLAGRRAGSSEWQEVTYTIDDAKTAGLAGKPSWRQYPMEMLLARATSRLGRLLFADVLGGLGTTEEYADLNGQPESGAPLPPNAPDGEATASPKPTRRRRRPPSPEATAAESDSTIQADAPAPETAEPARSNSPEDEVDDEQAYEAEGARIENLLEEQRAAEGLQRERELIRDLEASGATLVDEAKAKAEAPEKITAEQRTKLHALFGEKAVSSRESKLAYAKRVVGHEVASSNDLTVAEASKVIDALEAWDYAGGGDPFAGVKYDPATAPFPEGY